MLLLIGTCRLKLAAGRLPELASRSRPIVGHVHYPEEIEQMLRWATGEIELPLPLLPLIHVDIADGKFDSPSQVERLRSETCERLAQATTIVIEVSSFKRVPLREDGRTIWGNINAFATSVRQRKSSSSFFDPAVADRHADRKPETSNEADFVATLHRVLDRLSPRRLILVPHFQAVRSDTGLPIENRPLVRELVRSIAAARGVEFFDQDRIGQRLGSATRVDSSHYAETGERAMAACLNRLADGPADETELDHLLDSLRP